MVLGKPQNLNIMSNIFKTSLISFMLIFSEIIVIAQSGEVPLVKKPIWILQGSASALKTHRTLSLDENEASTSSQFNLRELTEKPSNGFQIELNLKRKIAQKWFVGGGLNFTKFEYQSNVIYTGGGESIDPQLGFVYNVSEGSSLKYQVGYYYVGTPLGVLFQQGKGNVTLVCEANISPSYLIGYEYKTKTHYNGVSSSDRYDLSSTSKPAFNLFAGMSVGFQYQMFTDISLGLQAQYTHGFFNLSNTGINETLNGSGIKFTLGYSLNQPAVLPEVMD